jgi:hypothetical protein
MHRLALPCIIVVVWGSLLFGVKVQAQSERPSFAHIGEGFTAADASGRIEIGYRMFTSPDMPAVCAAAPSPARLIARKDSIKITVGTLFSFREVNVLAVDATGRPLPPVPITVEIEDVPPGSVAVVNGETYKQTGRTDALGQCCEVLALRPGTLRARIRTACAEPGSYRPDYPSCVASSSKHCKEIVLYYRVKSK